ncbi:hypothetical protein [Congregibacter litoralis]|uniref:hypothetical protein n=1 Tax=Congregibacter litoralis TaxID=393662 RepID=UPI000317D8EF|nr:hypothetical protein [Congregibacter litoralis]
MTSSSTTAGIINQIERWIMVTATVAISAKSRQIADVFLPEQAALLPVAQAATAMPWLPVGLYTSLHRVGPIKE